MIFYWVKKVGMFFLVGVLFCGGLVLVGGHMGLRSANAGVGIAVTDQNIWMQSTTKAVKKAAMVVEQAMETANSVNSVVSLSPEGMIAKALGIESSLGALVDAHDAYVGLMKATQSADQAFGSAFKGVGSFASGGTEIYSVKGNSLRSLQMINQDAIYLGEQANKNMASDFISLKNSLQDFSTAVGDVQKVQTLGNVAAVDAKLSRAEVDLVSAQNASKLGKAQYVATEQAAAVARSEKFAASFNLN